MSEKKKLKISELAGIENVRLKNDPNISSVGYGLKIRDGKPIFEPCLQYFVKRKFIKTEDIVKVGSEIIPKEKMGFATDVIQEPVFRPSDKGSPTGDRGSRKENPLVGGTSTTVLSDWYSFPTGYGTLGGICFDAVTGEKLAISNAHVLGMESGKDVIQPWLPASEYLEATVKFLACGPVISYILDTTVPSPLTAILTIAAAGAWTAAIASDAEDPVRWGQRVGALPAADERTQRERIRVNAEIPFRPFAGRFYSIGTSWDYTRETTGGSFHQALNKTRENNHTLVGKRVWTDRGQYNPGDRVRICAELQTDKAENAHDYFVVAHCFPQSNPGRVVQRILEAGECKYVENQEICIHGFQENFVSGSQVKFPFSQKVFTFESKGSSVFYGPWPAGDPNGKIALRIPYYAGLTIKFPPSSRVKVEVFHYCAPVKAEALNDLGQTLVSATTTVEQNVLQTLTFTGSNITQLVLSGGGGEGFLVGICVFNEKFLGESSSVSDGKKGKRFVYAGDLFLDLHEPEGKWGVTLFVQTVNNLPVSTEPAVSAQTVGGIVVSDNIVDLPECTCSLLLDHIFEVV